MHDVRIGMISIFLSFYISLFGRCAILLCTQGTQTKTALTARNHTVQHRHIYRCSETQWLTEHSMHHLCCQCASGRADETFFGGAAVDHLPSLAINIVLAVGHCHHHHRHTLPQHKHTPPRQPGTYVHPANRQINYLFKIRYVSEIVIFALNGHISLSLIRHFYFHLIICLLIIPHAHRLTGRRKENPSSKFCVLDVRDACASARHRWECIERVQERRTTRPRTAIQRRSNTKRSNAKWSPSSRQRNNFIPISFACFL